MKKWPILLLGFLFLPICCSENKFYLYKIPDPQITEMAKIPAGDFRMGSQDGTGENDEHPRHKVWLDNYYLDKYEVTYDQFKFFYEQYGQRLGFQLPHRDYGENGDKPVTGLSWYMANEYCKWAKKRLPTEAEWEKACRSGTDTDFFWGDNADPQGVEYAWFFKYSGPHAVGGKKPNPFGLYDMVGNVFEWCSDWYDENYYKQSPMTNPKGPESGDEKVLRGSSWGSETNMMRSAKRSKQNPGSQDEHLGCRCAKDE